MEEVASSVNFKKQGASEIYDSLVASTEDIKDIFDEIDFMMEAINGEDSTWKGKSQASFYESFRTISGKFDEIGECLDRQNDFLKVTINNYQEGENKINSDIEKQSEEFNIN